MYVYQLFCEFYFLVLFKGKKCFFGYDLFYYFFLTINIAFIWTLYLCSYFIETYNDKLCPYIIITVPYCRS